MKSIWWAILPGFVVVGIVVACIIQTEETTEWKAVQQLQKDIHSSMRFGVAEASEPNNESEAEKQKIEERRVEKIFEYRDKLKSLPEKLQKVARDQMREMFVSRMEQRVDIVLALPPEQRDAELDKQIDEWDRRIAAWNKRRGQENKKQSGGGGGDNAGGSGVPQSAGNDKKKTDRRRGWVNASKEQRDTWRRELLSRTTPQQRAKWHEYRRLMDERRKERGLSARSFN